MPTYITTIVEPSSRLCKPMVHFRLLPYNNGNMFRRPTKKQQLIQRLIVSIVAIIVVTAGVTVAIFFLMGYRLDSDSGKLEQGALLQFDSQPGNATVTINGENTGGRTATKRTVLAGTHTFLVQKDGYEDWTKTLTLKAGTLTWLDYVRLVPVNREVAEVAEYDSLVDSLASPNQRAIILQPRATSPQFVLADIRSDEVTYRELTLPEALYTTSDDDATVHQFALRQWDTGGRYVLLEHRFGETSEWIVLDTESVAASVNVSRVLNISLRDASFVGTDGKTLYGLTTEGIIRKLDLGAATISRGLVTRVESFTINQETKVLSYVGIDPDDASLRVVGVYRDGDATSHIVRKAESSSTATISTGRYHGNDYIAYAFGPRVTVLKGSYPVSGDESLSSMSTYATFALSRDVSEILFSESRDVLVARADGEFIGYELEHKRATRGVVDEGQTQLTWLDDAHLWSDSAKRLTMQDFDGTNVYQLAEVAEGFDVTLSPNERYLYFIGTTDEGYALQRIRMILE